LDAPVKRSESKKKKKEGKKKEKEEKKDEVEEEKKEAVVCQGPGAAVYNCPLPDINFAAPMVVRLIEQLVDGGALNVEGIFRIPGNENNMRAARDLIDQQGPWVVLPDNLDMHDIAGMLKAYLRFIPQGELMFATDEEMQAQLALGAEWKVAKEAAVTDDILARAMPLMKKMPYKWRATLAAFCGFLNRVEDNRDVTKMTAFNLAMNFGPTFFHTEDVAKIHDTLSHGTAVIEMWMAGMRKHGLDFFDVTAQSQDPPRPSPPEQAPQGLGEMADNGVTASEAGEKLDLAQSKKKKKSRASGDKVRESRHRKSRVNGDSSHSAKAFDLNADIEKSPADKKELKKRRSSRHTKSQINADDIIQPRGNPADLGSKPGPNAAVIAELEGQLAQRKGASRAPTLGSNADTEAGKAKVNLSVKTEPSAKVDKKSRHRKERTDEGK
jgi:hypothetical protein